jgi:stage V sporulation protein AE
MQTQLILAALLGGLISAAVQILIDKTMLTPSRILVGLVTLGTLLYAIGVYEPLFDIFGCGISIPLVGFGASIARGVTEAVDEIGALGILTGGLSATSAGITLALLLGLLFSLITKGKRRSIPNKRRRTSEQL